MQQKARVLIVEDSLPFQKMIRWILQGVPELQVVGMVGDGLEAVRKTKDLRPDLIIMDVGLPKLNGIEAARQILEFAPQCNLLFVTQEASADVVQHAFQLGARGYVIKDLIGSELLDAVSAVLDGKQFVSSGISIEPSFNSLPAQRLRRDEPCTSGEPSRGHADTCSHELQIYSDEAVLLSSAARFVKTALRNRESMILIAGDTVRSRLFERLQSDGIDRVTVVQRGNYISLDVREAMSLFMANGMPDPVRFIELLRGLIAAAAKATFTANRKVAIFAECAALLWAAGNTQAAFRVEQLCNELAQRYGIKILCAYPAANFHGDEDLEEIKGLCAAHSAVDSC